MKRLQTIAQKLKPYRKIADIGCDHGYLIIEAFKISNDFEFIAIDNKIGPLNTCRENINKLSYSDKVRFSLSSGIKDINDDTEVLVLAGMGGMLVCDILKDNIMNTQRIITCANRNNYNVRKYITSLGFKITDEDLVNENNKYYQIIVFDKSKEICTLTEKELMFGPIFIKEKKDIYISCLKNELETLLKIENVHKSDEIETKIEMIRSIIK